MLFKHVLIHRTSLTEALQTLPADMSPAKTSKVVTPFNPFNCHFATRARFDIMCDPPQAKCFVVFLTPRPTVHPNVVSVAVCAYEPKT